MKRHFIPLLAIGLFTAAQVSADETVTPSNSEKTTAQVSAEETVTLSDQEKLNYAFGYSLGKSFKSQGIEIDLDILVKGMKDGLSDSKAVMSQQEMTGVLKAFQREQMAKQMAARQALVKENLKAGKAFLAENKTKEGVVTLPSGLQYKVITPGTGKTPKATDKVKTNYRGTLIDGTEFDSSYKRGKPATFPVKGVIKGWTEALQLMKEGAKWQLFIPSDLAYGKRGAGKKIGTNATLIFEIELISIEE
ncbi:MAG: FKBP-type peptidyl-prolyl cis-trans isomerase [Pseudomonadota bacterium]